VLVTFDTTMNYVTHFGPKMSHFLIIAMTFVTYYIKIGNEKYM